MDGGPIARALARTSSTRDDAELRRVAAIAEHYDRTTKDYRRWSATLHMHFGCWRWPLSPFARGAMVAALSATVHERLALEPERRGLVLDLGCGVGAAARQLARARARVEVLGLTLAPAQVELGTELSRRAGLADRVRLIQADYREIPRTEASAIGAYAIESACYDPTSGDGLIREAARVLEPGARLVIADGFRRRALPRAARSFERGMSAGWVLPELPSVEALVAALRRHGFVAIDVEDISLRVLPSVLHIPWVALVHRVREGASLGAGSRRGHLRASLWCLAGALLWPRRFGYFMITARLG